MFFQIATQGKRGFLLFLLTLLFVVAGMFLGQLPLAMLAGATGSGLTPEMLNSASLGISQTTFLAAVILGFLGALLGLAAATKWLYRRPFLTLITPFQALDWPRIGLSFLIWFALTAAVELVLYIDNPDLYQWTFELSKFLPLLLVALLLPIQTSFEEIFFRGYLLQQFGLAFNNRLVPLLLTSVLFGLMHSANPEVQAFGFGRMMVYYIGFGVILGLGTILDDRLELALGVHAATNIYGALIVTFEASAIQTPAMFTLLELDLSAMTILFFVAALLFMAYFARRYDWWSQRYKLISPIRSD